MIDILLSSKPLSEAACSDFVKSDAAGGIVTFVGTVRNQTKGRTVLRLEFEAYEPLAKTEMHKIAQRAISEFGILKVAIHHRIGVLPIGEVPVIISVAAPHRKAAFAACEFAIDTLKETVPIWKREFYEDGNVWVSATP